jgi:hypothetical protein
MVRCTLLLSRKDYEYIHAQNVLREIHTHTHTHTQNAKGIQSGESLSIHTIQKRMENTYC